MMCKIEMWLDNYLRTVENAPHDYVHMREDVVRIGALVNSLDESESHFLEWATKSNHEDGGYYYRTSSNKFGLEHGRELPECYPSTHQNIRRITENKDVFDYMMNEYLTIGKAKQSQERIDDRNGRTCDLCETRFDTYNGLARHRAKCKGSKEMSFLDKLNSPNYRYEYHGKIVGEWSGGTTTTW
jgi:hypothetical protein